jgi:hypothetical protein
MKQLSLAIAISALAVAAFGWTSPGQSASSATPKAQGGAATAAGLGRAAVRPLRAAPVAARPIRGLRGPAARVDIPGAAAQRAPQARPARPAHRGRREHPAPRT